MKRKRQFKVIFIMIAAAIIVSEPAAVSASVMPEVRKAAGMGDPGFYDGAADQALFSFPHGLAVNADGGLIIVDSYNSKIRILKDEKVSTLAGSADKKDAYGFPVGGFIDGNALGARFNHPRSAAVDSKGNIFVSDSGNNSIRIITGGRVYTFAGKSAAGYLDASGAKARFHMPSGMAVDREDNLYIADTLNHVIRKVSPLGEVTTFAGKYSKEGGYLDGAAREALFNEPSDVSVDKEGTVYVLDCGNQLVRKIKDGVVTTVAGTCVEKIADTSYAKGGFNDESSDEVMFNFPMGIDVTEDGSIIIADTWNHRIRVITPDGSVKTIAGSGIPGWIDEFADEAQFNGPADVVYYNGTLYISDRWNHCIRTMNLGIKTAEGFADRSELLKSIPLDKVTDEIQVWYEGSRLKFTGPKPYKEGSTICVPAQNVFKAWGAKVKWIKKTNQLEVKKKGFFKLFQPGTDKIFLKQERVYIETERLGELTKLRIEWFPEYNALIIEEREF